MNRSVCSQSAPSVRRNQTLGNVAENSARPLPFLPGPPAPGQSLSVNESRGQRGPQRNVHTATASLTPAYGVTGSTDWRSADWFYKHTEARLRSWLAGAETALAYLGDLTFDHDVREHREYYSHVFTF